MSKTGPKVPKLPQPGLCARCPESEGAKELWRYGGQGKSGRDLCEAHLADAQRVRSSRYRSLLSRAAGSAVSSDRTSAFMATASGTTSAAAGALAGLVGGLQRQQVPIGGGAPPARPEAREEGTSGESSGERARRCEAHRRNKALLLHKAFTKVNAPALRVKFAFRVLSNDDALNVLMDHHPEDYDPLLDIVFNVPSSPA